MIAPLLMMATLVAPQDPPSPHHLTPIPIINADFSGERNLSHYEPIEGSTSEASSPLSGTTTLTLRDTPRPEPSAASPQAAIEVARERELRDRYFLSIEPGATASLLLEGPAGPIRLAPGARYECSWAEGSDPGTGAPRGEVSLRLGDAPPVPVSRC